MSIAMVFDHEDISQIPEDKLLKTFLHCMCSLFFKDKPYSFFFFPDSMSLIRLSISNKYHLT